MQLIIDTSGTKLSVRNKAFFISNKSISRLIPTSHINFC